MGSQKEKRNWVTETTSSVEMKRKKKNDEAMKPKVMYRNLIDELILMV